MRISKRAGILGSLVVLAAATSAISFAATNSNSATITATAGTSSVVSVSQATSSSAGQYSGLPTISPVVDQVGSIGAGNLYTFTPTVSGDLLVTLYLNNAGNLANDYSYFNAQVTAYQGTTTSGTTTWTTASGVTSSDPVSQVLSLNNGYVTFNLSVTAGDTYDLAIDNGSFYATSTSTTAPNSISPNFYLTVAAANG